MQSWNTASVVEPQSDDSVCTIWGIRNGKNYLLQVYRERLKYSDLKARMISMARAWRVATVMLEYANSGTSLVRTLKWEGYPNIISYTPRLDKEVRFAAQTDKIRDGLVLLLQEALWRPDFQREILTFRSAQYDDRVDRFGPTKDWTSAAKGASMGVSVFKQMGQMFGLAKGVFCPSFSYYAARR